MDWCFPDTTDGIETSLSKGAEVLWLNTVLHLFHPILTILKNNIRIIGQHPQNVHLFDNKYFTNVHLAFAGCKINNR